MKKHIVTSIYSFAFDFTLFTSFFSNIAFLGNSGTGKTMIAKKFGKILACLGIFVRETVNIKSRSDLVGQYIGKTAIRTKNALWRSLEGILFIDEAYQLAPSSARDYGGEAITEMVNFLDKYIGCIVVIVAGYEKEMGRFFESNQGLSRRFPTIFFLSDYSRSELCDIFIGIVEKNMVVEKYLANLFYSHILHLPPENISKAGGDMLNLASTFLRIKSSLRIPWSKKNASKIVGKAFFDYCNGRDRILRKKWERERGAAGASKT